MFQIAAGKILIVTMIAAFFKNGRPELENITYELFESLQKLYLLPHPLTVSGFGSGANMAQQLHISSSSRYDGVGVFGGVYYRCTGDTQNNSMCWEGTGNFDRSISDVTVYEKKGLIDSLSNLQHQKLFFWLGTQDGNLHRLKAMLRVIDFYQRFIPTPENLYTKIQSAHNILPSMSVSESCASASPNSLANCNYSGSYEVLKFLIGPMISLPGPKVLLQPLRKFKQLEFFGEHNSVTLGLDEVGFLYVPMDCSQGNACHLHVFLHGCTLQRERTKDLFILQSGYLEIAEANNIVMLFPQTIGNADVNPEGCWDTEGFTGVNYATKTAPQIVAINNMVDRLFGIENVEETTTPTSGTTSTEKEPEHAEEHHSSGATSSVRIFSSILTLMFINFNFV